MDPYQLVLLERFGATTLLFLALFLSFARRVLLREARQLESEVLRRMWQARKEIGLGVLGRLAAATLGGLHGIVLVPLSVWSFRNSRLRQRECQREHRLRQRWVRAVELGQLVLVGGAAALVAHSL